MSPTTFARTHCLVCPLARGNILRIRGETGTRTVASRSEVRNKQVHLRSSSCFGSVSNILFSPTPKARTLPSMTPDVLDDVTHDAGTPVLITPGRVVRVTPVFDTYGKFAAERQAIFMRRIAGLRQPWTRDVVLASYRFTNVYRASDRVTQYLIRHVLSWPGGQVPRCSTRTDRGLLPSRPSRPGETRTGVCRGPSTPAVSGRG